MGSIEETRLVGVDALREITRHALQFVIATTCLLAGVIAYCVFVPVNRLALEAPIETAIIKEQIARADSLGDVDVLLTGDSSCLMGIDPQRLGEAIKKSKVESLCTIGFVGPAGYAQMLDRYFRRGRHASIIILVLNGESLVRREEWRAWETAAEEFAPSPADSPSFRRLRLRQRVASWLKFAIVSPLPGQYGTYYGTEEGLRDYLRGHGGSAIDPNPPLTPSAPNTTPYVYRVNDMMLRSLDSFMARLSVYDIHRFFLVLTPIPADFESDLTRRSRNEVVETIVARMGGTILLDAPASLPNNLFAKATHLNDRGRQIYTRSLSTMLRARIETAQ